MDESEILLDRITDNITDLNWYLRKAFEPDNPESSSGVVYWLELALNDAKQLDKLIKTKSKAELMTKSQKPEGKN